MINIIIIVDKLFLPPGQVNLDDKYMDGDLDDKYMDGNLDDKYMDGNLDDKYMDGDHKKAAQWCILLM